MKEVGRKWNGGRGFAVKEIVKRWRERKRRKKANRKCSSGVVEMDRNRRWRWKKEGCCRDKGKRMIE